MTTWNSNVLRVKRVEREKATAYVMWLAFQIEALAKVFAPVLTGFLRNSIQVEQAGEMSAVVFVGAWYAIYVELGTRYRSARPFLLPALEQVAAQAGATIERWF